MTMKTMGLQKAAKGEIKPSLIPRFQMLFSLLDIKTKQISNTKNLDVKRRS